MTSILKELLSFWQPDRRWSKWHCSGVELICVFALYLLLPSITMPLVHMATNSHHTAPQEEQTQTDNQNDDKTVSEENQVKDVSGEIQLEDKSHPLIRLLKRKKWTDIVMVIYMGCILAPFNEELLFRGCLQNWLQGLFTRLYICRRRENIHAGRWYISFLSILIPALIFALIHYRSNDVAKLTLEDIQRNILNCCIAWTALPVLFLGYLFIFRELRFRDMFGTLRQIPSLILSGVKWIWILFVSYAMMISALIILLLLDINIVADPIGIFPLALAMGYLYYRTQSILPSIALHFLFNFSSLCMVLPFVL